MRDAVLCLNLINIIFQLYPEKQLILNIYTNSEFVYFNINYAPNFKKLKGHIALGLSGCPSSVSLNKHSCIDFYSYSCLHPLSNERKSMFKSGDSRAVWTWVCTWKYLKWALHYLHDVIYGKHCRPDWSFRRCFCSRKRCVRLWRYDDVMTFESTQPTPFCLEKSSVRNGQFNVLAAFSVRIGLE